MLTATQCKMARAALDWGMRDLAERAGVSANTIERFENGRNEPIPATLKTIRQAFEAAGVAFIAEGEQSLSGGQGVRLYPRKGRAANA